KRVSLTCSSLAFLGSPCWTAEPTRRRAPSPGQAVTERCACPTRGRSDKGPMPQLYKPTVHLGTASIRATAVAWIHRAGPPISRRYYKDGWGRAAAAALSAKWQRRLGLDDQTGVGSRRLEIGSGDRPQRGYIHVDQDPWAWHVEVVAHAWRLPFPENWADE